MESNSESWMNYLVFSTTLCANYDKWKDNLAFSEILNVNTNPMCINLKKLYPTVDDKVIRCITLGFFCNMYNALYGGELNETLNAKIFNNNVHDTNELYDDLNDNLSVD